MKKDTKTGGADGTSQFSGSENDLKDMDLLFSALCFCLKRDVLLGDFFDDLPSDEAEHSDFDKAIIEIQRLKTKGWCLDNGHSSDDFKKLWDKVYSEKFQNTLLSGSSAPTGVKP